MRVRQDGLDHARRIETTVRGGTCANDVDPAIRHSWSRCLDDYSLDPTRPRKPQILDRSELQARREKIGAVLPIARIEMLTLSKLMHGTEFGIVLTDCDGVILNYVGNPSFADAARRSGFREGAVWSERELGTNGMGTCLMTQRLIVIHRSEHFLLQNTALTCSAAPIFDPQGRMIAALDISGHATDCRMHSYALVDVAAQNIENRALLDACKPYFLVRFHRCPEFVTTTGEGVLAFDDSGVIVGANRAALDLLDYADRKVLCGQAIDTVLDSSFKSLTEMAMRPGLRPEPVSAKFGSLRLFAVVQPPAGDARRMAPAAVAPAAPSDDLEAMRSGDPVLARNVDIAGRVLNRDISILLLGETGTGKGYFAKAIHNASRRASKPFVSVNCAAIPEMLIESELFGYRSGAFTGASREGYGGRILQANGGTLFLDEIGDMPLSLQARLLSVIEDREVLPLGGSKPVPVDIRIISATHRDPIEMIARGAFREDLYYRLNGITLTMPPLRQRQDGAEVVRRMLRIEGSGRPLEIDPALLLRLAAHTWPGNLRQLRNVIRTMLALSESDRLTLEDFDESWLAGHGEPPPAMTASVAAAVPAEAACTDPDDDVLASAECDALRRTLEACGWNVSAAADRLRLSRKTMYRKMHRHGLVRHPAATFRSADALHGPTLPAAVEGEDAAVGCDLTSPGQPGG